MQISELLYICIIAINSVATCHLIVTDFQANKYAGIKKQISAFDWLPGTFAELNASD